MARVSQAITRRRHNNDGGNYSRDAPRADPGRSAGRRRRAAMAAEWRAPRGRARIGEVESHFAGLKLGVGRRLVCGDAIVVEWTTDYGDGRLYRNVSIAELRDGKAIG